jgi:hypothetical protein
MHDLLQEMAYSIVHEESEDPGERSRLFDPEDIYKVLKENKVKVKLMTFVSLFLIDIFTLLPHVL